MEGILAIAVVTGPVMGNVRGAGGAEASVAAFARNPAIRTPGLIPPEWKHEVHKCGA